MKHLLITAIAAVVLTGCSKSPEEKRHILLDASAKGQTEVVRKALEEGKHSEYDPNYFEEAMRVSIDTKNFEITELIIKEVPRFSSGADALEFYLRSPIDISDSREKDFIIKLIKLVKLHFPPKKRTAQFFDRIFHNSPKLEIADFLINEGIKLHPADIPDFLRNFYNKNEVLEFLLSHGADINSEHEDGSTVLDVAIRENSPSVEFIKSKGGKANSDNSMFLAVKYFNKPALLELLNDRKKLNTIDANGNTLLHLAAKELNKECIELLLDKGANTSAKNNESLTPIAIISPGFPPGLMGAMNNANVKYPTIMQGDGKNSDQLQAIIKLLEEPRLNRAVRTKNIELAKLCIAEKDSLESRGERQATPLYYAAYNVDPVMTKLLLENGAEVNALDYQGETPLHTAVYHSYPNVEEEGIKVIKLLIENGSDVNRVKKFPQKITPLDFAKDPNGKIAELLRKHSGKTAKELKAEGK
jgi:ankyrin repeat protein